MRASDNDCAFLEGVSDPDSSTRTVSPRRFRSTAREQPTMPLPTIQTSYFLVSRILKSVVIISDLRLPFQYGRRTPAFAGASSSKSAQSELVVADDCGARTFRQLPRIFL